MDPAYGTDHVLSFDSGGMDINSELLQLLECPTCLDFMDDIIQLCKLGHSVCGRCRRELKSCPICRSRFSNARNYLLERISDLCQYPCVYIESGCQEVFKKSEIKAHVECCNWKPYKCRLKDNDDKTCSWAGPRCEIDKHCKNVHNLICCMQEESLDTWHPGVNDNLEVQIMNAHGEKFYLTRILKDDVMYWTLNFIGKDSGAENFTFQLMFTKDGADHPSMKIEAKCQSFHMSTDDIIDTCECIGIPIKLLRKFTNKSGIVCFKVRVNRIN